VAFAAGQPATLLPGGVAARAVLLAEAGVPAAHSVVPILLGSLLDQLAFGSALAVAALFFETARPAASSFLAALGALGLLLAIPAVRRWSSRLLGCLAQRLGWAAQWRSFTAAAEHATRPGRLGAAGGLTALAFASQVGLLDLALRSLGAAATPAVLLLAYTLPSMAGRLTVLPAGVGLTELGMVGLLSRFGTLGPDLAAAAAALFRIADSLLQAAVGCAIYFLAWQPVRRAYLRRAPTEPAERQLPPAR
jgi:uncharacterized membrane protein YbhN (UPF0104 family)